MAKKIWFLVLGLMCCSGMLLAQQGRVVGTVLEGGTTETLIGVNVVAKGTSAGTNTDFEGDYTLELTPGTYTIVYSFMGFQTKEIEGVVVEAGKAARVDVSLDMSQDILAEVVVTASARENTESAVLNMQRNAPILMDGLSAQSIQRKGASTIVSAVRSVPGVSVQGGKYVYVRGLGDRYSKSILNGMDIPGLDPDKNTVQMDIFPTNILENLIVIKSASADLPADFTGGMVNIVTKDIPSEKRIGVSLSAGFNPEMHFNDRYVGYQGSSTDFLGFDNGDRDLPISSSLDIPTPASPNNESLEGITRSFNPQMAAKRLQSMPDFSVGIDFSNQYQAWGNQLGLIAALNYKNSTTFYEGFQNGIYQRPNQTDPSSELRESQSQLGDLGGQNVLLSGLAGLNYKTGSARYALNLLHI